MEKRYYTINEESARTAHEMMSFSDYRAGSKTEEYRRMVDNAYEVAEKQKQRTDPKRVSRPFHQKEFC